MPNCARNALLARIQCNPFLKWFEWRIDTFGAHLQNKMIIISINYCYKLPIVQFFFCFLIFRLFDSSGAAVKMEHFQAALDPRKQELLEARFLGARVSGFYFSHKVFPFGNEHFDTIFWKIRRHWHTFDKSLHTVKFHVHTDINGKIIICWLLVFFSLIVCKTHLNGGFFLKSVGDADSTDVGKGDNDTVMVANVSGTKHATSWYEKKSISKQYRR